MSSSSGSVIGLSAKFPPLGDFAKAEGGGFGVTDLPRLGSATRSKTSKKPGERLSGLSASPVALAGPASSKAKRRTSTKRGGPPVAVLPRVPCARKSRSNVRSCGGAVPGASHTNLALIGSCGVGVLVASGLVAGGVVSLALPPVRCSSEMLLSSASQSSATDPFVRVLTRFDVEKASLDRLAKSGTSTDMQPRWAPLPLTMGAGMGQTRLRSARALRSFDGDVAAAAESPLTPPPAAAVAVAKTRSSRSHGTRYAEQLWLVASRPCAPSARPPCAALVAAQAHDTMVGLRRTVSPARQEANDRSTPRLVRVPRDGSHGFGMTTELKARPF
mmetsp:Transcript_58535/g.126659  ORF Transcript_58535/g.126659 Transcript_58535/m.126659 type:complete len:331 (+) Transcript_58535:1232-2224(+)